MLSENSEVGGVIRSRGQPSPKKVSEAIGPHVSSLLSSSLGVVTTTLVEGVLP